MRWFLILLFSILLLGCKKQDKEKDRVYIQYFTTTDTNWRILIDKYHEDYLPPIKFLYIKDCVIILDSSYNNKGLSFRVNNYENELGICTEPIIYNDTMALNEPIYDINIKNLVNMNNPYLSGTIRVRDDSLHKTLNFKLIKFSGYLRIVY